MPRRHAGSTLSPYTTLFRSTNAAITTGGKLDAVTDVDNAAEYVEQTDAAGVYGAFSIATDGTWTYTANSAFDELKAGEPPTETQTQSNAEWPHIPVKEKIHGTKEAAHASSQTEEL